MSIKDFLLSQRNNPMTKSSTVPQTIDSARNMMGMSPEEARADGHSTGHE